jgi:hypothetical protein
MTLLRQIEVSMAQGNTTPVSRWYKNPSRQVDGHIADF